jgi:hypothetical protein
MTYEYSKYMKVLTTSNLCDKNAIVKFVESHDSYYGLGWTKYVSPQEINNRYYCLSNEYPNTIYFARPFDNSWKNSIVKESNESLIYTRKRMYI